MRARLKKQVAQAQVYQARIHHLASELEFQRVHDPLTHLPNRFSLDQIFQSLVGAAQDQHIYLAFLHLTFEQLTAIRAALGMDLSYDLVKQIGHRLDCMEGVGGIAYLNDHQFAVVMHPSHTLEQAQDRSETVARAFNIPIVLQAHTLFLTPKIGVAVYPQDGINLDTLLLEAEMAATDLMGQSHKTVNFYSADLHQQVKYRFAIEADLHYALDRQQLQVYYQPQIDLKTYQLVGAEALMRWFHPVQGSISATNFIPIAETTGLIVPMGEWVLRTACQQVSQWFSYPPYGHISVNLSPRQFSSPNLIQTVMQALADTGLPNHRLELEITESMLMQDANLAQQLLSHLQQAGIHIAIDDFGVGYSSFNYLRKFPLNTLKIDRCFVKNIGSHATNQKIVTAIIQMAHDLGLRVIAEGVEHREDLEKLQELGCDIAQGYWYSQPLPPEEFEYRFFSTMAQPWSQMLQSKT